MKFSKKARFLLFILLVLLCLIIRIPSIPHEKGADSFYIHRLANTVTSLGRADWWINWYAIFGFYPYSYASAVPFLLSGMAQLVGFTGVEMEKTVLLLCVTLGVFSAFTAYILAAQIYDDFQFKYLTSLFFSLSQGIMVFSTWEISSRGPFIIFLPLFFFVLLKKIRSWKKTFLFIMIAIFLLSTHHYVYFLLPFTLVFVIFRVLSRIRLKLSNSLPNYVYLIGLVVALMFPFLTRSLIEAGSRYEWIGDVLKSNIRYTGPLIIFTLGGLIYLILKNNKRFSEWYFLGVFATIIPFSYSLTYGAYVLLLFFILLISISIRNVLMIYTKNKRRIMVLFVMIILLSFVSFSAYYNHERTGKSKIYWYMKDSAYKVAVWGSEYIPYKSVGVGGGIASYRMIVTSDGHPYGPKVNISELEVVKVPPFSKLFFLEGPYILKPGTRLSGEMSWFLNLLDIDDPPARRIIRKLNISYFIMDAYYLSNIDYSIRNKKNIIYSNGRISVWTI